MPQTLTCSICAFCYDPLHPTAARRLDDRSRECCKLIIGRAPRYRVMRLHHGAIDPADPPCAAFTPARELRPAYWRTDDAMIARYLDILHRAQECDDGGDDDLAPPLYPYDLEAEDDGEGDEF